MSNYYKKALMWLLYLPGLRPEIAFGDKSSSTAVRRSMGMAFSACASHVSQVRQLFCAVVMASEHFHMTA